MRTGSRRGDAGYTLAVLLGILVVLGIALGAAMPHWAANVQRGKEAELIARGLQYAEAIRVFQRRFGRLPNTLAELVEVEPRSIRRLWKNPFARGDDAGWAVLVEVPGGEVVPVDPATGALVAGGAGGGEAEDDAREGSPVPVGPGGGPGVAGPIHGVKSKVRGEAYKRFFDQKDFGDWEFTVERLVAATSALSPGGLPRRADYASIGRPFQYPPPGGEPGAGAAVPAPAEGGAPTGAKPPEKPGTAGESDETPQEPPPDDGARGDIG